MSWRLENGAIATEMDIERETGIRENSKFVPDGDTE